MKNYYRVVKERDSIEQALANEKKHLDQQRNMVGITIEGEDWIGIRTIIYLFLICICASILVYGKNIPNAIETFSYMGLFLILPLLSIIASIRFVAKDVGYSALLTCIVFHSIVIFSAIAYWFYFLFIVHNTVWIDETQPQDFWLLGTIIALIPSFIILIGALIRLRSKKTEIKKYKANENIFNKKSLSYREKIDSLEKEAERIRTEGKALYQAECSKSIINFEIIRQAADCGVKEAACLFAIERLNYLLKNEKSLDSKDIKEIKSIIAEYTSYASGCKNKNTLELLEIWEDTRMSDSDLIDKYSKSEEAITRLNSKLNTVNSLKNSSDDNVKYIAEKIFPKISSIYAKAQNRWAASQHVSLNTGLATSSYIPYSAPDVTDYDFDDPVIPSGEVDLTGTSPIDWE